jgi:glycosyltransferase involved in cell wall biosynthesis
MLEISLILPVHNEALGIIKTHKEMIEILEKMNISYEIIYIENGSTDNSFDILNKIAITDNNIRVYQSKIGWGNAVRLGIEKSRGKLVCYLVSDGQIEPSIISVLYKKYLLNQNPRIGLWKIWRTSRENKLRLINSRIFSLITRLLFNISSLDINATPKLMEAKLLKSISLTAENIAVDLELLISLKKMGVSWIEIPVQSKNREYGESTTKIKTIREMLKWMLEFYFRKKEVKN